MNKELLPWAQEAADRFYRLYGDGNCSCHLHPPCGSCTDEGNPRNLAEDPDAWAYPYEVIAVEAKENLVTFVNELANKHLTEMKREWSMDKKGGAA